MSRSQRTRWWLKGTGLAALALGVVLGFADLRGWLRHAPRVAFLEWARHSEVGIKITDPAAQAFLERFPPPSNVSTEDVTHVTKWKTRVENGPALDMAFNYMLPDQRRTNYVATLRDVEAWADESPYGWLAWALTVIGLIEVVGSTAIEWQIEQRRQPQISNRALHPPVPRDNVNDSKG